MSLLEDIYVEDVDMEGDLERIIDNDDVELANRNSDEENEGNSHSEAEEVNPKKVNPEAEKKAKVVKNPRFVLNPARLMGPRGISTIEGFFKDFKFRGKGYEKEDLDVVMKKLEHWAHRLYPKFQFDDCLDKIASLGNKKIVQVHMRKIRLDMIHDDDGIIRQDDSDDENQPATTNAPVMDEFDMLLEQQIALARSTPATNSKSNSFNINSSFANISAVEVEVPKINTPQQITDEQKARMMKNRLLAEERRLARMKQNVTKPTETHTIEDSSKTLTEDTVNRLTHEDSLNSRLNGIPNETNPSNLSPDNPVDTPNKINASNHEDAVNEGSKESDIVEKNGAKDKDGISDGDEMMDIDSILLDSNNV